MARKWLLGLLVLGLLLGSLVGGTLALFSSQSSSDDNTFVTQTFHSLKIYRDDGDSPPTGPMFYTASALATEFNPDGHWYPGKSVMKTMVMTNENGLRIDADGIRLRVHGLAGVPDAIRDDLLQHMRITMTNSSGTRMLINNKTLYEISDLVLGANFQPFENNVRIEPASFHPARVTISFTNHPHDDSHLMALAGPSALLIDFVIHATQAP